MKKKKPQVPEWLQRPDFWPQLQDSDKLVTGYKPDDDISDLRIEDFAVWLDPEEMNDPAMEAVWEGDKTGNTKKIIDLIASNVTLTVWGRRLIADWLKRTTTGTPGRKTPYYVSYTHAERTMEHAVGDVNALCLGGMSKAEAIKNIANSYHIPPSSLRGAVRRGGG